MRPAIDDPRPVPETLIAAPGAREDRHESGLRTADPVARFRADPRRSLTARISEARRAAPRRRQGSTISDPIHWSAVGRREDHVNNLSIRHKLLIFLGVTLVAVFSISYVLFAQSFQSYSEFMRATAQKLLLDKYRQSLKTNTEVAVSLLSAIYNLENLTGPEKLVLARRLVRPLRFEQDGYFFAYEEGTGRVLIHGANEKLEGQNLWNLVNPADKSQYIVRELDRVAKDGSVFLRYTFPKPGKGAEDFYPKLGTAMLVPGTGMWVGTGAYIDDISKSQRTLAKKVAEITRNTRLKIGASFLILGMIAIAIVVVLARHFTDPIRSLIQSSEKIRDGDYDVEIRNQSKDEIGQLARTFNAMVAQIRHYTNNLGQMVDERTSELNRTLAILNEKNTILAGLSDKLSRYLSPQIREGIFSGSHDSTITSKRKRLTVFFSDIRNFTATTERLETEVLTDLLNRYLDEMSQIALRHGATIDKFIGDAVVAFFGDPESKGAKEDALACVSMALEMRSRIHELQKEWNSHGVAEPFHIRMGINTGFCTVGNFGSLDRMDYTIIGSQVNLASRLESAADIDQILISYETYALVKDVVYCEKREPIVAKGISEPVQTYMVVDFLRNMDNNSIRIEESLDGFNFSVEVAKLTPKTREIVIDTLTKALREIGGLPVGLSPDPL
jgi:class 3 adenylate cyclase/HAMP domain-containing protein